MDAKRKKALAMKETRLNESSIAPASHAQLRDGYLSRLRRLLRLRRDHFDELNDQGLRLLDRSIFAAYCAHGMVPICAADAPAAGDRTSPPHAAPETPGEHHQAVADRAHRWYRDHSILVQRDHYLGRLALT